MSAAVLRFAPETGAHAPRMRSSVFPMSNGRWLLRVVAENGLAGSREFDTQRQAADGWWALYVELTKAAEAAA
jgi:hypothetical protein